MKPERPIDAIIQEIMKSEGLRSPRQVFEKYPRLGDWWNGNLAHVATDDSSEEGESRGSDSKL